VGSSHPRRPAIRSCTLGPAQSTAAERVTRHLGDGVPAETLPADVLDPDPKIFDPRTHLGPDRAVQIRSLGGQPRQGHRGRELGWADLPGRGVDPPCPDPPGPSRVCKPQIRAGGVEITKAATPLENAYLPIDDLQIASFNSGFDDFHDNKGIVAFGGDIRQRALIAPPECRLFVIGHTHHARMLVDRHPRGGPLVTMDCGAWIEKCTIEGGKTVDSAQFGVQYGNDLRIYQLAE
jgi:hypothetical protein